MDPTYITILVNGTNATKVLSTTATLLYNTLGLLPILVLLAVTGIMVVVMDIILRLSKEKNHENENQVQQRVNNRKISVDLKTLSTAKDSISFGFSIVLLIIIVALITLAAPVNVTAYQVAILLILLVAIVGIAILSDGYSELKKVMPAKVRKVLKITTTYSDGTTIEREKRYEY